MQGWRILDRLKTDVATRHIPICVVSTDDSRERALQAGAIGFVAKPLQSKDEVDVAVAQLYGYCERPFRNLVVALPASPMRAQLLASMDGDVRPILAEDGAAVRAALADADCVVVDESLTDFGPEDVIEEIERRAGICQLPIVLHAQRHARRTAAAGSCRTARSRSASADSLETALAQAAFLLHRSPAVMSNREREAVEAVHGAHLALHGKKALIVDDDMRNIFALATVLDNEGMVIVSADNGREAIRLVESDPSIDIVLMDIMMPEMDGIATMQEIRKLPRGRELPMVAVTAKAMKGDRAEVHRGRRLGLPLQAGRSDAPPGGPRGWLCR